VKRNPWEKKLTPEEEQEVLSKAMKYKSRIVFFRWVGRVISFMFFSWLILSWLSICFVKMAPPMIIFVLSMMCMFPYQYCVIYTRVLRDIGLERLDNNIEIIIFYRRIFVESLTLCILHGVVALVANTSRL